MHTSTISRPRPPGRAASARIPANGTSSTPATPDDDLLEDASKQPAPPTLELPPDDQPRRTLRNKLSSSSLSMSIPPDSPPTTFDDLPLGGGAGQAPSSPSLGRSTKPKPDAIFIPFPSSHRSTASSSSISSTSSTLPLPPHLDFGPRSRTVSARALLSQVGGAFGLALPENEPPALDPKMLEGLPVEETHAMLIEADRLIRERTREAQAAASIGKYLLDENTALRARHESLVARSPTKLRERMPASPATSSRNWRSSLGFPPPSVNSLRSVTSRPSLSVSIATTETDSDDESRTGAPFPSTSQHLITTPTRSPHKQRDRTTSAISVNSLFAPSPCGKKGSTSPTSSDQIAELAEANYHLHLELTDTQAEFERQELEGRKKFRKLQKEMEALKDELVRVEQRNEVLEEKAGGPTSNFGPDGRFRGTGSFGGRDYCDDNICHSSDSKDDTPTKPVAHSSTGLDQDADHGSPGLLTPVLGTPSHTSTTFDEMATPTSARRSPGNGAASVVVVHSGSKKPSPIDSTARDTLIAQLAAKIEELREENEAYEEQQVEFVERWQQAQSDMLECKKRCEELEEALELDWAISDHRASIGWRDNTEGKRHGRLKGNQRTIRSRHERSLSISPTDIFRGGSLSPTVQRRPGQRSISASPYPGDIAPGRTLGSELGSEWEDEGDGGDLSHDVGQYGDEDEDEQSNASTWTPTKLRAPHQDYYVDRPDPTLEDLIPPGSLRYSGPPDANTYERIAQAVAEAPAVWEAEDEFGPPPPRTGRGLLRNLRWAEEENDSDPWESKKYPEPDSPTGVAMIESREDVERREDEALWGPGKKKKLRRRANTKRSRRDQALLRLGLPLDYGNDDSADDIDRFQGAEGSCIDRNSGEDDDEGDTSDNISEFEYLNANEHRQRGDYYPVSLRARYAPRAMASWAANSAINQVINLVLYFKLFAVLGFAVVFALWQGPKKTMGVIDRQRRLR
ncbi:hypothetical protein T439DRAFT_324960 [Meredithblackwellia eburnea MCA 4105]